MEQKTRFNLIYLLIAIMGVLFIHEMWTHYNRVVPIPYSEFQSLLRDRKIKEVVITDDEIRGEFSSSTDGKTHFVTTRVDPDFAQVLDEAGVRYAQRKESTVLPAILSWVVPVLFFVGIWFFVIRKMAERGAGGGLMSIGRSKAKVYMEKNTKVTFGDVAGVDEAKQELEEIVSFLKNPAEYGQLGARMPRGVLLVGPPGTGKTLLARAVAGEAVVPFFSISGSEFVEMFVGVGAARVRDLFEQARAKAPCIIFIDELDALGRARNAGPYGGGNDEKEQTLNQLLVELDGFDPTTGIVLLAATNRPEILDPALLRAGRFDRQVLVDRPDRLGRAAILEVHMKEVTIGADVSTRDLASLTPGFTGAELANLVNEAALVATRRAAKEVAMEDFTEAIERIIAGLEKRNRLLNPRERKVVAYHEMGHAITALICPKCDPVHKVSIIPRGIGALGYTLQRPTEDRYLMTKEELEQKMTVLLGGRAAEHLVFSHLSTGAADDLNKASEIARSMVMRYGMMSELGHVTYDNEPAGFLGGAGSAVKARNYSDDTAREIDTAVKTLVQEAFDRARGDLETNRSVLENGAQSLLEKETLDEKDLQDLLKGVEGPQV